MPQLSDFVSTAEAVPLIAKVLGRAGNTDLRTAQMLARDVVKSIAKNKFSDTIHENVVAAYNDHVATFGEPGKDWNKFQWQEWSEPLEDLFDEWFNENPNITELCSVNFRSTVDSTCPRTEDEIERFVERFADDCYRCMTHHADRNNKDEYGTEKTAGQILSSVGITTPDIESMIPTSPAAPQTTTEEVKPMDNNELAAELHEGASMMGLTDNPNELNSLADNASDGDEIVSQSAFAALGVEWSKEKQETLEAWRMMHDVGYIAKAIQLGKVEDSAAVAANPAPAGTAEKPARKRTKAAENAAASAAVYVPQNVLKTLMDMTGIKAEDLAAGVGASRSTFINYTKGKGNLTPSDTSKAYMFKVLNDHIEALSIAKQQLEALP